MATTMQLSDLMTAVRSRADMLPSGYTATTNGTGYFVTEPELISYINQSLFELYDLLISAYGNEYFAKNPSYNFTTDGTTTRYSLPTDFYKLLGVDLVFAGSSPTQSAVTIKPFEFADRNRYAVPNFQSFYGVTNLRYRIYGSTIWLTPTPASGQLIYVHYIPTMTPLANLADTFDGISGWTEYVIVDAAIKCKDKEESDSSVLMAQKAALVTRIQAMADGRDAGSPPKVSDGLYTDNWWPSGSGSGDGSGTF